MVGEGDGTRQDALFASTSRVVFKARQEHRGARASGKASKFVRSVGSSSRTQRVACAKRGTGNGDNSGQTERIVLSGATNKINPDREQTTSLSVRAPFSPL